MRRAKAKQAFPIRWHGARPGRETAPSRVRDSPQTPAPEDRLAALVDLDTLRLILDDLAALEGIATALLDLDGRILQSAGWQIACTGYHRAFSASCSNCTESDLFLARQLREGEFVDYRCKNGLWDVVTPVFVGTQHLGNLYCGQFFYDDDIVDEAAFAAQAQRYGYDAAAYLAAIRNIPRVSRARVRQVMGLIVKLAAYLSHLSLTNLRLSESQGQLEALVNALPDPIWLKDAGGVFRSCNRALERLLGRPAAEIVGRTDDDFFSPEQAESIRRTDAQAIAAGQPCRNEEWIVDAESGAPILVETVKAPVPGGVLGIARNITERKRAEENFRLMSKVFSNSGEAILITDPHNRILAVNGEFTKLTGYTQEEAVGRNPSFLSFGNTPREVYEDLWSSLAAKDYWQGELWDRRKTGEPYPKRLSISVVRDGDGKIVNYIGIFQDITESRAAQDKIRYLAHHDALTGLPNRFNLHERMEQSIAFARRFGKRVAVMLIDLDRFKSINDTLGHNVGDQLLIQVARRLEETVRESDIVARLGGDEFVVMLTGVEEDSHAAEIAAKIVRQVSAPFRIGGHELRTSPSIGICFYPDDAAESNDLIRNADIAMYYAKSVGKGNYQFYVEEMQAQVARRLTLEKELASALAEGQLVLHYQPRIDLGSGRVAGMEALLRWRHPERGMLVPGDFIPLAEDQRLLAEIGKWSLEEACRQLACWHRAGFRGLCMALNLNAALFQAPALPGLLGQALERNGLPAGSLHLEIDETLAMRSPDASIAAMKALSARGAKLVLDDFGSGHSSLAYLRLFPIDIIKIGRRFVEDLGSDEKNTAICELTMMLAQKLGKDVVADGVASEEQREFLAKIGCRQLQGDLCGPPLAAEEAEEFIAGLAPRSGP